MTRCDLLQCEAEALFTVKHPEGRVLEVCRRHGLNIFKIGGEVVGLA